jgi:anthranilate synthase component 1
MKRNSVSKDNVITLAREIPSNDLVAEALLCRIQAEGESGFIFEGVGEDTRQARYSYIGVRPLEVITVRGGKTTLRRRPLSSPRFGSDMDVPGEPLQVLNELLARDFRPAQHAACEIELPPFSGGMVGYLGFEFTRYLEPTVESYHSKTLSENDAELMLFGTLIAIDHERKRIVLIGNVFLSRESAEEGRLRVAQELAELEKLVLRKSPREKRLFRAAKPRKFSRSVPKLKAALGPKRFSIAVKEIKARIRRGDLFQCVISEQFTFPLKKDSLRIYGALRTVSPSPYHFYLNFGQSVLLGASPERLVSVEGETIETCPIAGTRPRGKDEKSDRRLEKQLLASPKECAEHAMLVDLGRNDIGRVSRPGSVKVHEFMRVRRFSHVMHLVSTVQGRLQAGVSSLSALTACFPAGTLSGAPKISAMKTIAELEPVPRGAYGGALILHDFSGRMDSCIIIRSLFVKEGVGIIRAGAGIVADSTAPREYEEIQNKTRSVRTAVQLALSSGGHS